MLVPAFVAGAAQVGVTNFGAVSQSSSGSATNLAVRAVDSNSVSWSSTSNSAGSFWEVELKRPFGLSRVEVVSPPAPLTNVTDGLRLKIFGMRDQLLFQSVVTNPGVGGTWGLDLPEGIAGRFVRLGLDGVETNGAGNFRVSLAEVRLFGDVAPRFGPVNFSASGSVTQSSVSVTSNFAGLAVDGDPQTFSQTLDETNAWWEQRFDLDRVVARVEIVNVPTNAPLPARLAGLTLRVFDSASNSVASATTANPGTGATWGFDLPAGTTGRFVRIGLEGGATNGAGDRVVQFAEVVVLSSSNLAFKKDAYMVRYQDTLPSPTNAVDGNYSTEIRTTTASVDAFFETDLLTTQALYFVRIACGSGFAARTSHATLRLFDANHDSVFAQHLPTNAAMTYDLELPAPVVARYVRVGFENKERSNPATTEWYLGLREVMAFGRPAGEVGLFDFNATTNSITNGQPVTLSWRVEDLQRLELVRSGTSMGWNTAVDGTGAVVVSPTSSVEYVLAGSNFNGYAVRAVTVEVDGQSLPLQISEFVAENEVSLSDGRGQEPDWIEIHNPGNAAVNLGGHGLSDDPLVPLKWTFPTSVVIAAHGHLVVFASGRDEPFDAGGALHASFQLSASGGSVVLTATNGAVLDSFTNYPAQRADLAYGRAETGTVAFLDPSPGKFNLVQSYAGWLLPPTFTPTRGFFTNFVIFSISNPNAVSTLLISRDGSAPISTGQVSGVLTSSMVFRATVMRMGWKSPDTVSSSYILRDKVIAATWMSSTIKDDVRYTTRVRQGLVDLPTVSVAVPVLPDDYVERAASVEILMPDGTKFFENCGFLRFGGAYTTFTKKSYRLKFRKEYGAAKMNVPLFRGFDHGFLAAESFDEIDLHGGSHDMNARGFYMSSSFVMDTMNDMGSLNPHARFVNLYINGTYWGQYQARELLNDQFLAEYENRPSTNYVTVKGNDNVGSSFIPGMGEPPDRFRWDYVRANRTNYAAIRPYLDVTNYVDFMLMWCVGDSETEYRAAGAKEAGSGFKLYDADADGFLRYITADKTGYNGPGDVWNGMLTQKHPDFLTLAADRIQKHFFLGGALTPAACSARLSARMAEITNSLVTECARWGFQTPTSWEATNQLVQTVMFPQRSTNLFAQLRNRGLYPNFSPPALSQYGGSVTSGYPLVLNSPTGTIWYTTDGSDPRLPGGALSTNAYIATNSALISVTNAFTLWARVLVGTNWSALMDVSFFLASKVPFSGSDVNITEIHYNPDGSDDFQFVELLNSGSNVVDLTGSRLAGAVDFLFPNNFTLAPGAFAVVVEDAASFAARYQTTNSPYYFPNIRVAGEWIGKLAQNGERVSLQISNLVEVLGVSYDSGGEWPSRADGRGSSLEIRNLPAVPTNFALRAAFVDEGLNWKSSSLYHGSPGRLDDYTKPVVINEALTHTDATNDWVELHNPNFTTSPLAGMFLSDQYNQPFRRAFTNGETIAPGGFLLLDTNQLGFALSELGSDILLVAADGTNVIRFVDTVDASAMDREETAGRYTRSDGITDFTELRAATPSNTNVLPRVGPVVFSEIMYAPATNRAEFIELVNISSNTVALYDPARPTNRWSLTGAVEFTFPTNLTLPPCTAWIVCNTSPAAFRVQYGVPTNIPVFGPWTGLLDNAGEALRLVRPGEPEPDSTVPLYRVDRVFYEPAAPWPALTNRSIERVTLEAYGNDPANWLASAATNGTPGTFIGNRVPTIGVIGSDTFDEGDTATFTVSTADADTPWQTAQLIGSLLPPGASFDVTNGIFSWPTAEIHGPGTYTSRFVVLDSAQCPGIATQNFVITVAELNQPPSLAPQPGANVPAEIYFTRLLTGTDPDLPAQALTYQQTGLPPGLALDPTNGWITGSATTPGSYAVNISVLDDQSPTLSTGIVFNIRIAAPFALQSAPQTNNDARTFRFTTLTNENYVIEFSDSPTNGTWQPLHNLTNAPGELAEFLDTETPTPTQRFYRILWQRPAP